MSNFPVQNWKSLVVFATLLAVLPFARPGMANSEQPAPAPVGTALTKPALPSADPKQVNCVAKVIIHEAGNQPERGKMAVAQVVRARMRFFHLDWDACRVIKQRGQFFNVDAYHPAQTTELWSNAVNIARKVLSDQNHDVIPGAMYFSAVGHPLPGRRRLAQIEGHVFYR